MLVHASPEFLARHVPRILAGDELFVQFFSEPSAGSDLAGIQTRAERDGDHFVINGSKIWSSGANYSDWGMCLARTNWDVPKHRGLTVFMFPIHQAGVEVHRIEMLNGNREFCQEFMTDLRVPDSHRVGEVDQGWTVGTRWMFHERMAMAHNSPLLTEPPTGRRRLADARTLVTVASELGRIGDSSVRDLIGEAHMLELVSTHLQPRLGEAMARGAMSEQAASIGRLFGGVVAGRTATIAFEIAGAAGGAWTESDGAVVDAGTGFLVRQIAAIGGGTLEMARNVIAERVLGMPREQSLDRDVAFRDVPRGPAAHG
jgi:alkylation response protein AidB-like acyl-CoA dehydrogenase